tara:strand:- start:245 stop:1048 length:804 start_codon:yes stop_codon:yes gene_type:complete
MVLMGCEKMINMHKGYFIEKSNKIEILNSIRSELYELTKKIFNFEHQDVNYGLNNFHKLTENTTGTELNEKRVLLINEFNNKLNLGDLIFNAFKDTIISLLGPDILVQKNCNIVIQKPNDPNPSELHRDAPANSPYEIVLWIPLVDCYKSKAMYVVDFKNTKKLYEQINKIKDWELFEKSAKTLSKEIAVQYGEGLFFSTAILHGSNINIEKETRFSLNIRFKNIFSPSGLKNQLQFFRKINTSDLTNIGSIIELQKSKFLNKTIYR